MLCSWITFTGYDLWFWHSLVIFSSILSFQMSYLLVFYNMLGSVNRLRWQGLWDIRDVQGAPMVEVRVSDEIHFTTVVLSDIRSRFSCFANIWVASPNICDTRRLLSAGDKLDFLNSFQPEPTFLLTKGLSSSRSDEALSSLGSLSELVSFLLVSVWGFWRDLGLGTTPIFSNMVKEKLTVLNMLISMH